MGEDRDSAPDATDWEQAPTAAYSEDIPPPQPGSTLRHGASGRSRSSLQPVDIGASSLILPGDGTDWDEAGPTQGEASLAPTLISSSQALSAPQRAAQALDFDARYDFRRVLGVGGMGEVKLCADKTIGREVAMKVIRGEDAEARSRAQVRFVREARVQGQLEHPSIVPVYDLGADPEGNLYFTMKRVRGKSLEEIFAGLRIGDVAFTKAYSRRKLLTAFNNVCLTMAFAHARGVLHRDLKPANIMLGDFGEVYVLDWGLAKIRGTEDLPAGGSVTDASDVQHTVDGDVMGTPGYMAPEQMTGAALELDGRADVYALGALLFEILTQVPLHSGETLNEFVVSTLSDARAPSEVAAALEIPPELDRLCLSATALDVDERLASAAELSEAIEAYLDGDRDLALRREAADRHAKSALVAIEDEREGVGEAQRRAAAMREVGAALGMDPTNENARHTLFRLLTEPPEEMPAEAEEDLRRDRLEAKRTGLKAAVAVYACFLGLVPLILYMGVKSWAAFSAEGVAMTACLLLSLYHLRRDRDPGIPVDHIVITCLTVVVSTVVLGPFVLVPMLALANTAAYAVTDDTGRLRVLVAGAVAVLAPVALQLSGVLPSSFDVVGGEIIVRSLMFEMTPVTAVVLMVVVHLPIVVGCGWFVAKVRGTHRELETQMRVQAWQLKQLVPKELRGSEPGPVMA